MTPPLMESSITFNVFFIEGFPKDIQRVHYTDRLCPSCKLKFAGFSAEADIPSWAECGNKLLHFLSLRGRVG